MPEKMKKEPLTIEQMDDRISKLTLWINYYSDAQLAAMSADRSWVEVDGPIIRSWFRELRRRLKYKRKSKMKAGIL